MTWRPVSPRAAPGAAAGDGAPGPRWSRRRLLAASGVVAGAAALGAACGSRGAPAADGALERLRFVSWSAPRAEQANLFAADGRFQRQMLSGFEGESVAKLSGNFEADRIGFGGLGNDLRDLQR